MNLKTIAQVFGVRVKHDECGDEYIPGLRAHLYLSGSDLCLMGLDTRITGFNDQQLRALGGKFWSGDVWRDEKQRGHRDVLVTGIPRESWGAAIKLCRCRPVSSEKLAHLKQIGFK